MSTFSKFIFSVLLVMTVSGCANSVHESVQLASPNSEVTANVFQNQSGRLTYDIKFHNEQVILPSRLGIHINGVDLGDGVEIGPPVITTMDETYPTRGNHRLAKNHYVNYRYPITHIATERKYQLDVRLYDDGVAYRYLVPGDGLQHVNSETSSWTLPENTKTWFFERDSHWKLKSYAGWWEQTDIKNMPSISKQGPIQGTPLVFELPSGSYAVVTKAALYNYSGMRLEAIGNNTFKANFTEGEKGFEVKGDVTTPWRVTMLSSDLNGLVNSDLIENLNPAPDQTLFANTDYIKPGRSVWSWMSMRLGTIQDQVDFVDYAADLDFEYSLIDDGWKDWPNPWQTLKTITQGAEKKGVKVWVWVNSKDVRDPTNQYAQMSDYLDKVKAAGAIGVKTDFMDSEAKALIDFEIEFLRQAAQRQLLVNFHGSHSSTGEARTFPNELTREGIRGIEVNMHRKQHLPASHNAALPFTRMLVGHADYTPVYFTNPGPTSFAHQLALPVILYSPVQVYADNPKFLMSNPNVKDGLSVLKKIPTVWDETRVLPSSEIGQLAAFARRSGKQWFVAIANNEIEKNYQLDLSFLDTGKYQVEWVEDDLEAEKVDLRGLNPLVTDKHLDKYTHAIPFKVTHKELDKNDQVSIKLANGGGFVAIFTPKR